MRVVASCMLVASAAHAEPGDADALFAEGQRLIDAHKIDEACDKFDASLRLEPALGTRLNLADCRERQHQLADAYRLYRDVVDEAGRTGKPSQLEFARQRLDALEPRLALVTLHVVDAMVAGLVVELAGRPVAPAEWARPIAVAPGPIAVDASAPDREPFHAGRDGAAGQRVTIEIPALAVHTVARGPRRTWTPWILGGSGGALILTSAILGLHAKSVYDGAVPKTPPDGDAEIDRAEREADVATVLAITGAAAVAVGVVWYLRERRAAIVPVSDGRAAGVAVVGAW